METRRRTKPWKVASAGQLGMGQRHCVAGWTLTELTGDGPAVANY